MALVALIWYSRCHGAYGILAIVSQMKKTFTTHLVPAVFSNATAIAKVCLRASGIVMKSLEPFKVGPSNSIHNPNLAFDACS